VHQCACQARSSWHSGSKPLLLPHCRCLVAAADPLGLDSKLAALRIKLADIAKEHPVSSQMVAACREGGTASSRAVRS